MRTARTISITLAPEMLTRAQALARAEHRTMSELFREALRHYMAISRRDDPEWDALTQRTRAAGNSMGISSEADVERLSDEYREQKRRAS